MKKFAKLSAVFAALVLALSCFVACSNGDDDSVSVQALQGLWIYEGEGAYIVGDTFYEALLNKNDGKYYYCKEGTKFSVSGNKITMYYDEGEYYETDIKINGDKLTMKYYDEDNKSWEEMTYKKIAETPTEVSQDEFDKLDDSSSAGSEK